MDNPKISIIVPVYKIEDYLDRCVQSLISQTYKNLEIILVDDGSPDNSGKIADEYAQKDQRIQVIHKKNGGLSDARNAGMDVATGDYICFIDSDDWWINNTVLEHINKKLFNHEMMILGIEMLFPRRQKIRTA